MTEGNQSTSPARCARLRPFPNSGPVDTERFRDDADPSQSLNYCARGFHSESVAILATHSKGDCCEINSRFPSPVAIKATMKSASSRNKKTKPARPINAWVREAMESRPGLTYQGLADHLNSAGIGSYDRTSTNKMTRSRNVSFDEAREVSAYTGHPLPIYAGEKDFIDKYRSLTEDSRQIVDRLLNSLPAEPR